MKFAMISVRQIPHLSSLCLMSSDTFLKDQQRKGHTLALRLTFLKVECGFAKILKKGSIKATLHLVVIL